MSSQFPGSVPFGGTVCPVGCVTVTTLYTTVFLTHKVAPFSLLSLWVCQPMSLGGSLIPGQQTGSDLLRILLWLAACSVSGSLPLSVLVQVIGPPILPALAFIKSPRPFLGEYLVRKMTLFPGSESLRVNSNQAAGWKAIRKRFAFLVTTAVSSPRLLLLALLCRGGMLAVREQSSKVKGYFSHASWSPGILRDLEKRSL